MKTATEERVIDWRWNAGTSRLGVEYHSGLPVYWLDRYTAEGPEVIIGWGVAAWLAKFGHSSAWPIPAELREKVRTILDPVGR